MLEADNFPSFLESRLPQGDKFRVYHVSTQPNSCAPLFAPAPAQPEEATTLESHFLTISQSRHNPEDPLACFKDVLVLGIEVLIFTTADSTTVFVSKADSTGLLRRSTASAPHRASLAQIVITAFLEFLLSRHQNRSRLVLSLFARSQNQYLFPGSIENVTKHVLDDRQLIKWWCRVLDPLVRQVKFNNSRSVKAHVVVPGCDSGETRAFFPFSSRSDSPSNAVWLNAYPVSSLVEDASLPPRCLVPRFPDDPKSRFLEDLDGQRDENGMWRGISTLDQFWEMMSYRQECSAGRLVGFIWVILTPAMEVKQQNGAVNDGIFTQREYDEQEAQKLPSRSEVASAVNTKDPSNFRTVSGTSSTASSFHPVTAIPPTITLPITTREAGNTGIESPVLETTIGLDLIRPVESSILESSERKENGSVTSSSSRPPGELVLTAEKYQLLMDELLQLDFAGEDTAVENSKMWRDKAMLLANVPSFGTDVQGNASETKEITLPSTTTQATVNTITAVRKKRKAQHGESISETSSVNEPVVNMLTTALIRKKPKA